MRTTIDIDDVLVLRVMQSFDFDTKKQAVVAGLELLVMQARRRKASIKIKPAATGGRRERR